VVGAAGVDVRPAERSAGVRVFDDLTAGGGGGALAEGAADGCRRRTARELRRRTPLPTSGSTPWSGRRKKRT
jgi:hypothetical protein